MFNEQQKQTKQSMQVKFSQYLAKFKSHYSLPAYNILQDIGLGILKSHSGICLRIARALNEKTTLKKVCERFTRHLNKPDLGSKLEQAVISVHCRDFDKRTAIIVDDSDIIKSRARCMEGLKEVRDGSTGTNDQLGYDLLNIVAYQDSGDGYEIKPLCSRLIARDIELDSVSQFTEDRLIDINLASGGKGVYIFDRGYDTRTYLSFLNDNGMNYIIRSKAERGLVVDGAERPFREVAQSVHLSYRYKLEDSNQHLKCGIKRVSIRLNPHPVKHPDIIDTWLVVAQFSKNAQGKEGVFYFFCDFPGEPTLNTEMIIEKAIRMYRMRWKIEEVHKHIKQTYGWENIQLIGYIRLQNMNHLLLLTMSFLYSLKRFAYKYLQAFPAIMKYRNKDWKSIYNFVYYRLSVLVNTCFASVTRFNIQPYKGIYHDYNQLEIPCMKNGGM